MDLKAIALGLGVSERTVNNWRDEGAPLDDMDELKEWLGERRHTSRATKQILNRRQSIEARATTLVHAYVALTNELSPPMQSDWESHVAALLHTSPLFTTLVGLLSPEFATDPEARAYAERLRAETWPISGGPSELDENETELHEPASNKRTK